FHFRGPKDFRRDRRKDLLLQKHHHTVVRVLADDVVFEMPRVLDLILDAVAHCKSQTRRA
ncbi:hypothetical protein ACFL59_14595, partial [Planctomycetota bacterium]